MADALYYETRLLCPLSGTDGSTAVVNEAAKWSAAPGTFVINGSAGHQISAAQAKWGGTSLRMNGGTRATGDVTFSVAVPAAPDLRSAAAGWTMEVWARFDSVNTRVQPLFGGISNNGTATMGLWLGVDGKLNYTENDVLRWTESSASVVANQWTHIAITQASDGVVRVFRDGTLLSPTYNSVGLGIVYFLYLGSMGNNSNNNLAGYLQDFRFTGMACRYTASFTAPTAAFDTGILPVNPRMASPPLRLLTIPGVFVPSIKKLAALPIKMRDVWFGGLGLISGTTKVKGTPNFAVRRKVRLYREPDGQLVGEQWSNAITGDYAFTNVDINVRYTVLSYDYEHNFRAVVADNLTPDPMP